MEPFQEGKVRAEVVARRTRILDAGPRERPELLRGAFQPIEHFGERGGWLDFRKVTVGCGDPLEVSAVLGRCAIHARESTSRCSSATSPNAIPPLGWPRGPRSRLLPGRDGGQGGYLVP